MDTKFKQQYNLLKVATMMMPCPTTIPLEVKTSRQQETVQADTVGTLVIGCADY